MELYWENVVLCKHNYLRFRIELYNIKATNETWCLTWFKNAWCLLNFFGVLLSRRRPLRIIYSLTHLHFLLIVSYIHEVMQHFGAIESNEIESKQIGTWLRLATMINRPFWGIFSWFSKDLTLLHHMLQDVTLMCQIWF